MDADAMSACISSRGEYSYHEPDADYVCTFCGVLDEDALIAELNRLRVEAAAHEQRGYCRAIADVHRRIATDVRSTAKHVPTDPRGRAAYRRGLRRVWDILGDLLEATQ
jgi:transcription initiation factor TFIIIB Brf1 subunit/transcription initiation factor TFIIB